MLSKRLRSILFVFFLLFNSSTIVHALEVEGVEVSGTASVDILSHYMWRGQQLSDKAVLQPEIEVTYGGFGFNFWSNYDLHTSENTETDYTLFYDFSLGKLNFEIGAIYYAIDSGEDTSEFTLL